APSDPEKFVGEGPQHLRQRECQNAEEDSRMPHADVAEQGRYDGRDRQPDQDVELHRMNAGIAQQKRDRIGADAEKGGMTKRQQPGIAEQQIEAERGDGGDQSISQELRLIEADVGRQQRQQHEHDGGGGEQQQFGPILGVAQGDGCHHAVPNGRGGWPRSTRPAMRERRATPISGKNWSPAVRTKLTTSAPTSAPCRLPTPPITTTTKASISASTPMPSTAAWLGTM